MLSSRFQSENIAIMGITRNGVLTDSPGLKFDGTHAHAISTDLWPPGSYLYTIRVDGQNLYTGKIQKQ